MVENPAGLADASEPMVLFGAQGARLESWFARKGEAREDRSRWLGGFGLAVGTPLPGVLSPLRFGLALSIPAERVLRVRVAERLDEPQDPTYDGRPDRLAALTAVALEVLPRVKLGAALALTPVLDTPTDVTYVAGRGEGPEDDVVVRLDRELRFAASPLIGLRTQPTDDLGLAIVYRAASISRASGSSRTVAGGILADDPIDYFQMWSPPQLTAGVHARVLPSLALSFDATWSRYSVQRDGFNRRLEQPFENTLTPRLGAEVALSPWIALRAGYAYVPSPVPEQRGNTTFLGADAHQLGAGAGFDLRRRLRAPLRIDVHARADLGATQSDQKDPGLIADADRDTPGKQIDDLGYPGFESRATLLQLGVTLTLFVGKERTP